MPEQTHPTGHGTKPPVPYNQYRKSTTRLLKAIGIIVTVFGAIFLALPYWWIDTAGRDICNPTCVPDVPSYGTIDLRALGIVVVSAFVGFLPLVLFLIGGRKRRP